MAEHLLYDMSESRPSLAYTSSPKRLNAALLALRVACGLAFLYHGGQIFLSSPGPAIFAASLHMPAIVGYLVGVAELGGGLAVLSGVLVRIGAACIVTVMTGAILLVHLPHGYGLGHGGMEYALTQLLIALALLLVGGGEYSLARFFPDWVRKL